MIDLSDFGVPTNDVWAIRGELFGDRPKEEHRIGRNRQLISIVCRSTSFMEQNLPILGDEHSPREARLHESVQVGIHMLRQDGF